MNTDAADVMEWVSEKERIALDATPGPWTRWEEHPEVFAGPIVENVPCTIRGATAQIANCENDEFEDDGDDEDDAPRGSPMANARHIATFSPETVLALLAVAHAAACVFSIEGPPYDADEHARRMVALKAALLALNHHAPRGGEAEG